VVDAAACDRWVPGPEIERVPLVSSRSCSKPEPNSTCNPYVRCVTESSPAKRIVITGAGVGGVTLALLSRRRGVVAEVVEQAPELREVGAAIALAGNATRVLQHLDPDEGLAQLSTEPIELIYRDGRDGHRVAAHPVDGWYRRTFGAPFYGLHRMALQQLLGGAWGPEHVHLGCRVETIKERDASIRVLYTSGRRSTPT
jgi:salicylate hydroxylase